MSQANSDRGAGHEDYDDDDDDDDGTERYFYNENADEDEFGLPSISSTRRESKKRIPSKNAIDPGGGPGKGSNDLNSMLTPERQSGRARANSSDIAEERGVPVYPSAKQSEGKILRPQYKDILRGLSSLVLILRRYLVLVYRSCKLPPSDQPSPISSKRNTQRSGSLLHPNVSHR